VSGVAASPFADTSVFAPGFGADRMALLPAAVLDTTSLNYTIQDSQFAELQNAGAITGTTITVITLGADAITLPE
jgi:hypothetical protein